MPLPNDWIKTRNYGYHVGGKFSLGSKELYCDYATSFGLMYQTPSCFKNPATKKVTIHYGEYSKPDYLVLCDECAEGLRKDVNRHGYKMNIERLQKSDKDKIIEYAMK